MYFRTLFNWLIPPIREYEKSTIFEITQNAIIEDKSIITTQINSINYVKRDSLNKEVLLYDINGIRYSAANTPKISFSQDSELIGFTSIYIGTSYGNL